jgi:hypothetical protein
VRGQLAHAQGHAEERGGKGGEGKGVPAGHARASVTSAATLHRASLARSALSAAAHGLGLSSARVRSRAGRRGGEGG